MSRGQTVGDWIHQIAAEGLENSSTRFYSNYPAQAIDAGDPQQQGRVKVKVRALGFDSPHPKFCYPITPYAGPNCGFYFPPEQDSPVWVSFDHGDITVPRVIGSWWPNRNQEQEPPQEEPSKEPNASNTQSSRPAATSHIPAEFCKSDGSAPTARGIKTRGGHVLMFEDAPDSQFVEMSTGKMRVAESNSAVLIGKKAEKHHRLRFDDANEEVVLSTHGETKGGGELTGDETDAEEFDSRNRHSLTMRDTSDDRFIHLKTIGTDESTYLELLMSDTDESIELSSADIHFVKISDADDKITVSTAGGYEGIWDEAGQLISIATPNRNIDLSDAGTLIQVKTPNQSIELRDTEGVIVDDTSGGQISLTTNGNYAMTAQGDQTVSVTGNSTTTISGNDTVTVGGDETIGITGNMTVNVTGTWQKFAAAASIVATGAVTITGATVAINSAAVTIGQGSFQSLCNEAFISLFNSHQHLSANPGAASTPPTLVGYVAIPGVHSTINTRAT